MAEAVRDSHILMRYRGAPEERERALTSGPLAVKDFLDQFEGDEKVGVALEIASELSSAIQGELDEDFKSAFYAKEIASSDTLTHLAENVEGLRWISGVAGVAEYLCEPVSSEN